MSWILRIEGVDPDVMRVQIGSGNFLQVVDGVGHGLHGVAVHVLGRHTLRPFPVSGVVGVGLGPEALAAAAVDQTCAGVGLEALVDLFRLELGNLGPILGAHRTGCPVGGADCPGGSLNLFHIDAAVGLVVAAVEEAILDNGGHVEGAGLELGGLLAGTGGHGNVEGLELAAVGVEDVEDVGLPDRVHVVVGTHLVGRDLVDGGPVVKAVFGILDFIVAVAVGVLHPLQIELGRILVQLGMRRFVRTGFVLKSRPADELMADVLQTGLRGAGRDVLEGTGRRDIDGFIDLNAGILLTDAGAVVVLGAVIGVPEDVGGGVLGGQAVLGAKGDGVFLGGNQLVHAVDGQVAGNAVEALIPGVEGVTGGRRGEAVFGIESGIHCGVAVLNRLRSGDPVAFAVHEAEGHGVGAVRDGDVNGGNGDILGHVGEASVPMIEDVAAMRRRRGSRGGLTVLDLDRSNHSISSAGAAVHEGDSMITDSCVNSDIPVTILSSVEVHKLIAELHIRITGSCHTNQICAVQLPFHCRRCTRCCR